MNDGLTGLERHEAGWVFNNRIVFFLMNYLLAFGYKLLFVSRCIVSNIFASVKNYLFIYN